MLHIVSPPLSIMALFFSPSSLPSDSWLTAISVGVWWGVLIYLFLNELAFKESLAFCLILKWHCSVYYAIMLNSVVEHCVSAVRCGSLCF